MNASERYNIIARVLREHDGCAMDDESDRVVVLTALAIALGCGIRGCDRPTDWTDPSGVGWCAHHRDRGLFDPRGARY